MIQSSDVQQAGKTCPECGAALPPGVGDCQELCDEVLARSSRDSRYLAVHRLLFDAYALQHPERICRSPRSLAAHLSGLCWALEYAGEPALGAALEQWLDGSPAIETLEPPRRRGELTIADMYTAECAEEHIGVAQRWARSVWDAWAVHHETVRRWIREARKPAGS